MAGESRVAGVLYFKVDGIQHAARGNFSYSLGGYKREAVEGADRIHGYTEKPIVSYIEGDITDRRDLDMKAFDELDGVTVTLEVANGKTILIRNAWNASERKVNASEGSSTVRFESSEEGEET